MTEATMPATSTGAAAVPEHAEIQVGDRIRFDPQPGNSWWDVRARNERFIIATQQARFKPKGALYYTVVDLTGWTFTYNGAGPGIVRSSLNTLGGGYDLGPAGEGCAEMLAELLSGQWELSHRRVAAVRAITRESAAVAEKQPEATTSHTCPYPASGCTAAHCDITAARAQELERERAHKLRHQASAGETRG